MHKFFEAKSQKLEGRRVKNGGGVFRRGCGPYVVHLWSRCCRFKSQLVYYYATNLGELFTYLYLAVSTSEVKTT